MVILKMRTGASKMTDYLITHKEAMRDINVIAEKLTITQSLDLSKTISTIRNYINDTEWLEKELEELKRDVERYFELEGNYQKSLHEYHEMEYIKNKLMKVGNE